MASDSVGQIASTENLNELTIEATSELKVISPGGAVYEQALYSTLKAGHFSGAAVYVFEKEPYNGPLTELNNIILTPHIGSYAKEARV